MTIAERATAYGDSAWGRKYPASRPSIVRERGGDVLYATWVIGNDYRNKSTYYGAYPNGYLPRVASLFPDVPGIDEQRGKLTTLHAFSGSLPSGCYVRCDSHQPAECQYDVCALDPGRDGTYALIYADPPYSDADAEKYGTPMIQRAKVLTALARVAEPGGHLVWLDCVWPMHRKSEWRTVGRITIIRSTNHRVRLCSIFERQ